MWQWKKEKGVSNSWHQMSIRWNPGAFDYRCIIPVIQSSVKKNIRSCHINVLNFSPPGLKYYHSQVAFLFVNPAMILFQLNEITVSGHKWQNKWLHDTRHVLWSLQTSMWCLDLIYTLLSPTINITGPFQSILKKLI